MSCPFLPHGRPAVPARAPTSKPGTPAARAPAHPHQGAQGRWLLSPATVPGTSAALIGRLMILFHFNFRKKNHGALVAEDSWSAWDVGRYIFLAPLGTRQMGGHSVP